jgi:hypothetical protein
MWMIFLSIFTVKGLYSKIMKQQATNRRNRRMAQRTQLIFTHLAVLCIGAGAAYFGQSWNPLTQDPLGSPTKRPSASGRHDRMESSHLTTTSADLKSNRSSELKKPVLSPSQRFTEINRLGDKFEQQRALMELTETLGPQELQRLAEQYTSTDHLRGSYDGLGIILHAWTQLDPLAALDFARNQANDRNATATVISTWASKDPAAAESWVLAQQFENPNGAEANPYLPSLIRGLVATDLEKASLLVQQMPRSRERGSAVETITHELFLRDKDSALAYGDSITDTTLRGSFVSAITDRLLRQDLTQAADYVSKQADGVAQSRAAKDVAEALAKKDLTQATTWFKTLKPEAVARAASAIIPEMSSKDISSTAVWVSNLAGTPDYDRTVEAFIWSCDVRAPEQSAAWIQGISDPSKQLKVYEKMLGDWSKKDPAAVKNWVSTNPVPPEISRRFLNP